LLLVKGGELLFFLESNNLISGNSGCRPNGLASREEESTENKWFSWRIIQG